MRRFASVLGVCLALVAGVVPVQAAAPPTWTASPPFRVKVLGFEPDGSGPEAFGTRIRGEMDKWGKVIHEAKIKIE